MRRLAPRPLAAALEGILEPARPPGLLAAVQSVWPEVAGPALVRVASPVSERAGTVTVRCESAVWAQELELLASDLLERLAAALSPGPVPSCSAPPPAPPSPASEPPSGVPARQGRVERLRFVVGSVPNRAS